MDHRKASYAAALTLWRERMKSAEPFKPMHAAFGLSDAEAAEVERDGYDTDGLPTPLRPATVETTP